MPPLPVFRGIFGRTKIEYRLKLMREFFGVGNRAFFTFATAHTARSIMPAKTVFISRKAPAASAFAAPLRAAGWAVHGRSLVELTPLPATEIPEADWVFFSSRHAVQFFFPLAGAGGQRLARLAALGPGTASELQQYAERVDFTGTGDPSTTAAAFLPLATGKRVLFPEARQSQRSVARLLGGAITAIHLPVYANTPVAGLSRLDQDVLVFTSPMNAAAYLNQHRLQAHQRVVAIGQTTAAALREFGVATVWTATEPSESALAAAVLSIGD